jgi:hypothetical protein
MRSNSMRSTRTMAELSDDKDDEALLKRIRGCRSITEVHAVCEEFRRERSSRSARGEIVPATGTGYIGHVADKCDRITWRGRYYSLPRDVLPCAAGEYKPGGDIP